MYQVICINWGDKYGPLYINRLYGMVRRNLGARLRFVCFSDSSVGVRREVECCPLPPLHARMPTNTKGIWRKSSLWSPQLADLTGAVLFLDLDVVIVDRLEPFFELGTPSDVILARNVAKPFQGLGQTSIYRFPVGGLAEIQKKFAADPQGIADQYRYEQHFVTKNAPGGVRFWPRRWVRHFRIDCVPPFPINLFRAPSCPKGARVVIFAGNLNPPDAIAGKSGPRSSHRTPLEHVRTSFRKKVGFRKLRSYNLPAPWVGAAWQE